MLGSYGSSQTGDSGLTVSRFAIFYFREDLFLLSSFPLNLFVRYFILIMRRDGLKAVE